MLIHYDIRNYGARIFLGFSGSVYVILVPAGNVYFPAPIMQRSRVRAVIPAPLRVHAAEE